jgi:hypothetical protein
MVGMPYFHLKVICIGRWDIQNLEKCHAQVFFSCNYKSKHHKATFETLEFSKTEIHRFNIKCKITETFCFLLLLSSPFTLFFVFKYDKLKIFHPLEKQMCYSVRKINHGISRTRVCIYFARASVSDFFF